MDILKISKGVKVMDYLENLVQHIYSLHQGIENLKTALKPNAHKHNNNTSKRNNNENTQNNVYISYIKKYFRKNRENTSKISHQNIF